jgi:hypothetical protein
MKLSISDTAVPTQLLSVDTHRFGHGTEGSAIEPYALSVSRYRVLSDFQKYYHDYVADTAAYGANDDEPVARQLEGLQFPSFPVLFDNEPDILAAFLSEVAFDFLEALFASSQCDRPRYFIRTVDTLTVGTEGVTLEGLLFKSGILAADED